MDFVVGLLCTQQEYDFICVVWDMLTMSAYIIPIKSTHSAKDYARSSSMIFCVSMVFCYPSYRIDVHNSHLVFGGLFKKGWVVRLSYVPL